MRILNRGRFVRTAAAAMGLAAALASPALAGDIPPSDPYMIGAPWGSGWSLGLPRTKWTGYYLGVFAGGSRLDASVSPSPYVFGYYPSSRRDAFGGGLWGGWLDHYGRTAIGYGLDASIQYNGAERAMSGERIRDNADFDLRGRLGLFTLNDALFLYGLAGGGAGLFDRNWDAGIVPAPAPFLVPGRQRSSLNFGFEAGGGAEAQVIDKVTLRAEYVWRETPSIHHLQDHQIRLGVAYHF